MRRFALLALLALVPSTLAAQMGPYGPGERPRREGPRDTLPSDATRGYAIGVTTFAGGLWQPSGLDAQLVFRSRLRPFSSFGLGVRAGSYIQNQATFIGGTQGFYGALVGWARVPLATLFLVGDERYPSVVRLELVPEVVGALGANSPMAQGAASVIAAPLLGFSIGGRGPMDTAFLLLVGPAWFGPKASEWHTQVSMRFQAPRGERRPRSSPPS